MRVCVTSEMHTHGAMQKLLPGRKKNINLAVQLARNSLAQSSLVRNPNGHLRASTGSHCDGGESNPERPITSGAR